MVGKYLNVKSNSTGRPSFVMLLVSPGSSNLCKIISVICLLTVVKASTDDADSSVRVAVCRSKNVDKS